MLPPSDSGDTTVLEVVARLPDGKAFRQAASIADALTILSTTQTLMGNADVWIERDDVRLDAEQLRRHKALQNL